MNFVLGNLPEDIQEEDIKELLGHHRLTNLKFLKNHHIKHSPFECVVALDIKDPITGSILESHLNNHCLKGNRISFHRVIF